MNNSMTLDELDRLFPKSGERGVVGHYSTKVQWSVDRGESWKSKKFGSHEYARVEAERLSRTMPVGTLVKVGKEYF